MPTIQIADKPTLDDVKTRVDGQGVRIKDGKRQVWDVDNQTWVDDAGSGSMIRLGPAKFFNGKSDICCSNDIVRPRFILTWQEPDDVPTPSGSGQLAEWAGTFVVRKEGSAPNGPYDGVLIYDNKVRNDFNAGYYSGNSYFSGYSSYKTIPNSSSITDMSQLDLPKGANFSVYNFVNNNSYLNMEFYPTASRNDTRSNWYYYNYFIDDDETLEFGKTYYYACYPYTIDGAITDDRRVSKIGLTMDYPSWSTGEERTLFRAIKAANDGILDLKDDLGWEVGDTREDRYTLVQYRPKTRKIAPIKQKDGTTTNYANFMVWAKYGFSGNYYLSSSTAYQYPPYYMMGGVSYPFVQYNSGYGNSTYYRDDYTPEKWFQLFAPTENGVLLSSNGTNSTYFTAYGIPGKVIYNRTDVSYLSSFNFYAAITQQLQNDYVMFKGYLSIPSSRTTTGYNYSKTWLDFSGIAYIKKYYASYSTQYGSSTSSYWWEQSSCSNYAKAYGVMSPFEVYGSFYDYGWGDNSVVSYYNGMTEDDKNNAFTASAQCEYFKTTANLTAMGAYSRILDNVYQGSITPTASLYGSYLKANFGYGAQFSTYGYSSNAYSSVIYPYNRSIYINYYSSYNYASSSAMWYMLI